MISDKIKGKIQEAMKAKDDVRVSTLKMLSTELTNAEIAKKREKLTEQEELKVIQAEAKKRKDAIEAYEKTGHKDRAEKEKAELKILQEYLPKELDESEIVKIVDKVITETGASTMADMGKVIGQAVKKVEGRADGKQISEIVRNKLS